MSDLSSNLQRSVFPYLQQPVPRRQLRKAHLKVSGLSADRAYSKWATSGSY